MREPILVVDTDETNREFVAETLMQRGYSVIAAANATTAVTAVLQSRPALIILDVAAPALAENHFLLIFRRLPSPHAPVLAMVSGDQTLERAVVRCVKAYLDKPFSAAELLEAVEVYLPGPVAATGAH